MAEIHIVFMDESFTVVEVGEGHRYCWKPTAKGLMFQHDEEPGDRTIYPWTNIKSYTVITNKTDEIVEIVESPNMLCGARGRNTVGSDVACTLPKGHGWPLDSAHAAHLGPRVLYPGTGIYTWYDGKVAVRL